MRGTLTDFSIVSARKKKKINTAYRIEVFMTSIYSAIRENVNENVKMKIL